ncbi:MAG: hypothetical protein ACM30G_02570 [Micromonosporaceae bacterium]
MRTLIGAAEPSPEPSRISFTGTCTTTAVLWWATAPTQTLPREPYRTTAYVGTPVPEIEGGSGVDR